jgi:hypothetical protein
LSEAVIGPRPASMSALACYRQLRLVVVRNLAFRKVRLFAGHRSGLVAT